MRRFDDETRLGYILELIEVIDEGMNKPDSLTRFNEDRLFRFGLFYALQKITFILKTLSFDAKVRMPELPWQKLEDLHDLLAASNGEDSMKPNLDL